MNITLTKENSLGTKRPDLIKYWGTQNEKTPYDYFPSSKDKVYWKCEKENKEHPEYLMTLNNKTSGNQKCPYCSNVKFVRSESLGGIFPWINDIWSDINEKTPYDYPPHSSKKVYFKCDKGLHPDYDMVINSKIGDKYNCPYCSNQRCCIENSLGTNHPWTIELWSDKNTLSPFEITFGSNKKIWWKCELGIHPEYESTTYSKISNKSKCPYCTHIKFTPQESFGAIHPELSKEWSDKNNKTPYEYAPYTSKSVFWKCSNGHPDYKSRIGNRVFNNSGCPLCSNSGFKESKPANLYIVKWFNDEKIFLKYGITNNQVLRRVLNQKLKTNYNFEILKTFHFKSGKDCLYLETKISKKFEHGIISKEDFSDGFTETTYFENLDSILSLINEETKL